MDFSGLGDLVGSLSTSGAQWFKLVNSPSSVSVPGFAPPSQGQAQTQLLNQGISSGTGILIVGLLVFGAALIFGRRG